MKKTESIDRWIEKIFADSPNIRAILQLDPTGIGSAYEVMLSHRISEIRKKRFRTLLDELAMGDKELTPELIDSEEFLHAFYCITKASLDSRRKEKIRIFARLLIHAAKTNKLDTDIFEEFVSILDDLSIREFQILQMLHDYEINTKRDEDQNELQFASSFWDDFVESARNELGIDKNELPALLVRLNRTGLYETFSGSFLDYSGGKGKTTALFEKFIDWVAR